MPISPYPGFPSFLPSFTMLHLVRVFCNNNNVPAQPLHRVPRPACWRRRKAKEKYDNSKCSPTTNPLYLCMHMIRVGQARSMKLLSPVICRRRFPRVLNEWNQGMRGYGVGGVQRGWQVLSLFTRWYFYRSPGYIYNCVDNLSEVSVGYMFFMKRMNNP